MEIAVVITLLLLALISLSTSPFAWLPKREEKQPDNGEATPLPDMSVIIMVRDDIDIIERNMPLLLNQDLDAAYEIILVANEGDSLADDLMKRYKEEPRLRYTFIPATSRYVSRDKLGVTLGVKAAHHDWCLLMDGNSYPTTSLWLRKMAEACSNEANIVIGPSNFDRDSHRFQRLYRLRHFCQLWRESSYMATFAANHSNLCFRKSEFIANDGYRGNLDIIRGEYDFIVNKYAQKGMTRFVTSTDAMLTELAPSTKQWNNRRKYHLYSCRSMQRRYLHRLMPCIDAVVLHLTLIASLVAIILGAIMQNWLIMGTGIAAIIIETAGRTFVAKRATDFFNASIPAWTLFILEATSVFHTLADKCRTRMASKYDFTCHKL